MVSIYGVAALEATVCSKTAKPLTLVLPMKCNVAAAALPRYPMSRVGGVGAVSVCAGGVLGEWWVVPVGRAFSYPGIM